MVSEISVAVVADEEDFFSAGLSAVLERQVGYGSVIRARNLDQLRKILAEVHVDLVAIADDLPGSLGTETIRWLRAESPELRLAVVTHCADVREVLGLLAAGANGIISKNNSDCSELLRALQTVSEAGIFVPTMDELEDRARDYRAEPTALTALTERQQQVIKLLSKGHPNKVIARELGISPSTVKVHVHAAFRALGVHSRMAAAAALRPMPLETASRL